MSILDKAKEYKKNHYDQKHMEPLADGQSPHTLFITCSDSRISVNELTCSKAGEVFVIRNAGNLIDPYDEQAPSKESLTVEYAVQVLGVKEIVVCGHIGCGAMGAIKDYESVNELKLVKQGLKPLVEDYTKKEATKLSLDDLIAFNVKEQIKKLASYPYIKEKQDNGTLTISGWVYNFSTGDIVKTISYNEAM